VGSEVKGLRSEPEAKASLKWAIELPAVDVKPSDLPMSRMKRQ
jgi:hypothetical protein